MSEKLEDKLGTAIAQLQSSEEAWQSARLEAAEQFKLRGLPGLKDEEWKYTSLRDLKQSPLELQQTLSPSETIVEELLTHVSDDKYHLVFFQGQWLKEHSQYPEDKLNITHISDASEAESKIWSSAQSELYQVDAFQHLNLALSGGGLVLRMTKGAKLDKPLQLIYIGSSQKDSLYAFRHALIVEEGAEICVQEKVLLQDEELPLGTTSVFVDKNAHLEWFNDQLAYANTRFINHQNFYLERDSHLRHHHLSRGLKLSRLSLNCVMAEEGAKADFNGLYELQDSRHQDGNLNIHHFKGHTESTQQYKTLLRDESHAVFKGLVTVHKGAVKSKSDQLNNNLLLGDKARIDSRPQLDIYNDDVKCGHGATTGQLDESQLFYLQSRGVPRKQAEAMLCRGFAEAAYYAIENEILRNEVLGKVLK